MRTHFDLQNKEGVDYSVGGCGFREKPFSRLVVLIALQCNPTSMRGKFGLKLEHNSKLPRTHARFHRNANEQGYS